MIFLSIFLNISFQSDQQEIAQLKAELAQLEVERLNLSSQLTREQKSMESAVDKITEASCLTFISMLGVLNRSCSN